MKNFTFFGFYQSTNQRWCDSADGATVEEAQTKIFEEFDEDETGDLIICGAIETPSPLVMADLHTPQVSDCTGQVAYSEG